MKGRVLITGGAGFIAAHLARSLADRNWQVDLLDDFSRGVRDRTLEGLIGQPNVGIRRASLLDVDAGNGLDDDYNLIFHLAAIIGVRHVVERPYQVLTQNVMMTANALAIAATQKGLRRFVFTSSSEVASAPDVPVPTPEETPLSLPDIGQARTSYMLSKIYGEAMCHHAEIPFTIVRPYNVYGPRMGMSHVLPELLKRAGDQPKGGKLEVASVDHRRAFCYVSDAVEMIERLALAERAVCGTFNVGNKDAEASIGELARLVVETLGRRLDIVPLPPTPGSPPRRRPDMCKTIAATGYAPRVGLTDGVALTHGWYKDNVFGAAGATAH